MIVGGHDIILVYPIQPWRPLHVNVAPFRPISHLQRPLLVSLPWLSRGSRRKRRGCGTPPSYLQKVNALQRYQSTTMRMSLKNLGPTVRLNKSLRDFTTFLNFFFLHGYRDKDFSWRYVCMYVCVCVCVCVYIYIYTSNACGRCLNLRINPFVVSKYRQTLQFLKFFNYSFSEL